MLAPANEFSAAIRRRLRELGWTFRALELAADISESTLKKVSMGALTTLRQRRRVEVALGIPIWSAPEKFAAVNAASAAVGCDIIIAKGPEIIRRLQACGLKAKPFATRDELIAQLLTHFHIQPIATTTDQPAHV